MENYENINTKLKEMIHKAYEDESFVSMLKNYLLFLVNNKTFSDDFKIKILSDYTIFNQNYIRDLMIDFLLSSINNIIKNKISNDNKYFLFRYLSKKEIYKKILNINLKILEAIFNFNIYQILSKQENKKIFVAIDDYIITYEQFFNKRISKSKDLFSTFLNIKKEIINNDEYLISLINDDDLLLIEDNKIIIKDKLKSVLKLIFNLQIKDSIIEYNEKSINYDIENNFLI